MSLEFILGIKAGIGRSFAEAEEAMKIAGQRKEVLPEDLPLSEAIALIHRKVDEKDYVIHLHEGTKIPSNGPHFKERDALGKMVERSIGRLVEAESVYGKNSLAYTSLSAQINEQGIDPTTGALTPFGYLYQTHWLKESYQLDKVPRGMERFFILIDANNTHYWNKARDYDTVTGHIATIGRTLVKSARKEKMPPEGEPAFRRRSDAGIPDLVFRPSSVTRTHGSAGDEFVVELYCRREDVVNITRRLFEKVYEEQKNYTNLLK